MLARTIFSQKVSFSAACADDAHSHSGALSCCRRFYSKAYPPSFWNVRSLFSSFWFQTFLYDYLVRRFICFVQTNRFFGNRVLILSRPSTPFSYVATLFYVGFLFAAWKMHHLQVQSKFSFDGGVNRP